MNPIAAPAGDELLLQEPVDQVPVADEVDLLDAGRAVGDTGAREHRLHRTADLVDGRVDRRLVGEVDVDALRAGQA